MRVLGRLSDAVLRRFVPKAEAGACILLGDECHCNGVVGIRCCRYFADCQGFCWLIRVEC